MDMHGPVGQGQKLVSGLPVTLPHFQRADPTLKVVADTLRPCEFCCQTKPVCKSCVVHPSGCV